MHKTTLHINALNLKVNLGWREKERALEQAVLVDLDIEFPEPPKACMTDHLEDTVCYAGLLAHINEKLGDRHFHLIEHLGHEMYRIVKTQLPTHTKLTVKITKHPKLPGLTGGVCFVYRDK